MREMDEFHKSVNNPSVMQEAQKLIHGDRERDYAPPAKSFFAIANYWTTYLESRGFIANNQPGLTSTDVANMMILLKIARTMGGTYKRDTYVDICGYAGCAERIEEGK